VTVLIRRHKHVCVQLPTSAVNTTLPEFAAEHRAEAPLLLSAGACCRGAEQQSIDISCSSGAQWQTRRTPLLRSIDRTETDGRSTVS